MKKIKIKDKTIYKLTSDECGELFAAEEKAMENTYPVSGSGYAVALMTKNGNIYTGVSYLSDTDTLTMHSEATALAHAAIHGERDVVAITGPNCHICKQLIYENSLRSGIDIVILVKEGAKVRQIPISKLMPYPWPTKPRSLDKKKKPKMKKVKF